MEQGKKLVLEQIITTIASVADTAEDAFKHYYDRYINFSYFFEMSEKLNHFLQRYASFKIHFATRRRPEIKINAR